VQEGEAYEGEAGGAYNLSPTSRHLSMMPRDAGRGEAAAVSGIDAAPPSRTRSQPEAGFKASAAAVGMSPRVSRSERNCRTSKSRGDGRSDAGDTASVYSDTSSSSKTSKSGGKGKGLLKNLGYMFKFDASKV
jgi:hypothetical protein